MSDSSNSRFLSLDVFRGMTVCFMIIVNSPGSWSHIYAPLAHASWHGFTPTDLVFPSFLFAVGNAMSFAITKYAALGNAAVVKKVGKRTLLIFLVGYLMYWFPFFNFNQDPISLLPIEKTRIFGVLQRIALCYGAAALMIHFLSQRMVVILSVLLLTGYWAILYTFGDPVDPLSMQGNAGSYLDTFLVGNNHLYHGEGVSFDPEGLLSTLPAIVNVIIGYYAGRFIQLKGKGYETLARLLLAGSLLVFVAVCWNPVFPFNKKLWTSSFVLLTTGLDLVILSFLIFILEVKKRTDGNWQNFFLVFGKNTLFIYVLSEVLIQVLYMGSSPAGKFSGLIDRYIAGGKLGSFLFAICYMLLCWSIGWVLDKRKIYIKV